MRLQVAIDRVESLAIVPQVADLADILEVGTPLLKRLGLAAISTMRELAPGVPILADTKTVDAGRMDADMVFGSGATMMTILACAAIETHVAVAAAAERYGCYIIVDALNHLEALDQLASHTSLPLANVVIHSSTDMRMASREPSLDYVELRRRVGALGCAVGIAGGIGPANLRSVLDADPEVVVVGSAITESPDPRGATEWIASQLSNPDRGWRLASS